MRLLTLLLTTCALTLALSGSASAESVLRWKLEIKPDDGGRNPAGRVTVKPMSGPDQV